MPTVIARIAPPLVAALAAVLLAAPATALPECVDPDPPPGSARSSGHTQITTTPSAALTDPFPSCTAGFGTGLLGVWSGR